MSDISTAITGAKDLDALAFKTAITGVLADKVSVEVENLKADVAATLFTPIPAEE
jgi:hypothetical protein